MDEIENYISEHIEDYFAPEDMPLDDEWPDVVQEFVTNLSEEELSEIEQRIENEK